MFVLDGLTQHDADTALRVVSSLIRHSESIKSVMDKVTVKIPLTQELHETVMYSLSRIQIKNPPIKRDLQQYILKILSQHAKPYFRPLGIGDGRCEPNIISAWVCGEVKAKWFDCIFSVISEKRIENGSSNDLIGVATWRKDDGCRDVKFSSEEFKEFFEIQDESWDFPILLDRYDWNELFSVFLEWPANLEYLVENYARKELGIPDEHLSAKRHFSFDKPCLRNIASESEAKWRQGIVEVIACRAFDCLLPRHHDEKIVHKPGIRRLYVRKMNPVIRLHYRFDGQGVVYCLYSNGDHDLGL